MNEMVRRVKKLEEKADAKTGKRIEFIWCKPNEDEEQLKEAWSKEHPRKEQNVELICVGWADESTWLPHHEPGVGTRLPGDALSVDEKIEQTLSELEASRVSRADALRMARGEVPIPAEAEPAPTSEPGQKELTEKKAEELARLFSTRRHR